MFWHYNTLFYYCRGKKNQVDQESGFKKDILHWMRNEAALKNIPPEGYEGGSS
jgi:hypothetical protein